MVIGLYVHVFIWSCVYMVMCLYGQALYGQVYIWSGVYMLNCLYGLCLSVINRGSMMIEVLYLCLYLSVCD